MFYNITVKIIEIVRHDISQAIKTSDALVRSQSSILFEYLFININQLDALNFKFISRLYMFRAHVLIIRRAKLYYTVSGIITLKQVSGLKLLK